MTARVRDAVPRRSGETEVIIFLSAEFPIQVAPGTANGSACITVLSVGEAWLNSQSPTDAESARTAADVAGGGGERERERNRERRKMRDETARRAGGRTTG